MMKKCLTLVFLFAAFQFCALSHANEIDASKFTALRMNYANSSRYNPLWDNNENRKQIIDLFRKGKNEEGLKLARDWLNKFPFDAELHLYCAFVLHDIGKYKESLMHRYMYQGLLASIISSGDGRSIDKPFKVICVGEEYFLLRSLGAKITKQSLVQSKSGIPCDRMECEIDGNRVIFYFDVSISMDAINKLLKK